MVVPNHDGLPDHRRPFRVAHGGQVRTGREARPDGPLNQESSAFIEDAAIMARLMSSQTTLHYEKVREFARLAGNTIPDRPSQLSPEQAVLCARLIMEEAMETAAALGVRMTVLPEFLQHQPLEFSTLGFEQVRPADLVEAVDGCCDTRVVATFALAVMGVLDNEVQNAVDDNNLDKFDAAKGGYRDKAGKWIKPKNHPKPAIEPILVSQGWNGEHTEEAPSA